MNPTRFQGIVALIMVVSLVEPVLADPSRNPRIEVSSAQGRLLRARVTPQPVRLPVLDADDVPFIRLSTMQGLSQTRVQKIAQDDEGFIWFGTQYGLDRYDGYRFRAFTHDSERANSLGGVYIHSLFKDRTGSLWIGSDQTLDRFDPKTETFIHYPLRAPGLGIIEGAVLDIDQDRDGVIWLATGAGLFRLDPATGQMRLFQHDPSDPYSLSNSEVQSTLEDRHHRFWVADRSGLDEFDRRTGKVTLRIPVGGPIREFLVYEDRVGLLWLAYASGGGAGLATFDPETNVLTHYAFAGEDIPGAAFTGVYAITEDHRGNLWIGTGGIGLLRLDRERHRFIRYRYSPEDPQSLAEDHVSTLVEDSEGNMWIGLHSQGPNVFAVRPRLFRHVIHSLGKTGAGESLVSCIFQDHLGVLWIGTTGGLNRLDPQSGVTTFFRTAERGVSAGVVAIVEDPAGDLWLGTVGQGLKRFDPRTRRIKTYMHESSDPSSLSDDVVRDLRFDGPAKLWVTTWDGFDEFDIATERFTVHKLDPQRRTQRYHKIARDVYGNLWISSDSGLTRFDPRSSQFTVFTHTDQPGAISSNYVNFVFIDSRDQLWVATQNGLDKLNADGSFSTYRERDGLGGNAVSCILEDAFGHLWMSTNKGISRFDGKSATFTNYSTADGLGDLTGWDACFRSPSGEMFFGGFSGLIAFLPGEVVDVPPQAPIRLTDLRINGQSAQIGPAAPLTKSILYTSEMKLSHEQRNLSLEFASLNFLNSSATRYRYMMDGLDSRWNEVGSNQRVVSYTSLPSGTYVFHAQAAVGRGQWTEPGVALRIHVLPPWWQSWWFRTTLGALLVLMVWAIYSYRLRSIARQYDVRLEERVNERTRIARDLHDTLLQSFQGLLLRFQVAYELLPGRPTEAKQDLGSAIDRTVRAINEGRSAVQGLRASAVEGDDLAAAIKTLAEELASSQYGDEVVFHIDIQGASRPLHPMVRDETYQIAGEALRNSRQHAQASAIEVELRYDEQQLKLRVRDNGKGIDPQLLSGEGAAGHYGLHGMRERAELLGGKLTIWTAAESGTEIEFTLLAGRAYAASPSTRLVGLLRKFCAQKLRGGA
jgi:ligand-binding sensor domain-containing protein/signal transduction histidine kinase